MAKMLLKYWFIFMLLLIEGASLMAVELMSVKFLAPFFGSSLYVWTAVLSITLLGLTLGYYLGGYISKMRSNEKSLIFIISISAVFVFLMPYLTPFINSLVSGIPLIPGVIIASFIIIVPPVLCFGLIGPLTVKFLTQQTDLAGKIAGTVYFTSTFGGILATFIFGFYLIPEIGLKASSLITGIALSALVLLFFIIKASQGKNIGALEKPDIVEINQKSKSKKRKNLKVNKSVYLFAVIEGATVMIVELVSARMLAPYFGSSLYVWGTVIGITLFSLALGYYLGGRISIKYPKLQTVHWVFLGASSFIIFMHYFAQFLTNAFENVSPYLAISFISIVLIIPAVLLLGMIPTLLIKYITTNVEDSGSVTGKVFTFSSFSGILALPLFGFYIIPEFGLTGPSIVTGLLIGLIPFFLLISKKKYLAFIFVPILLVSFSSKSKMETSGDINVKYFSEGLLGQVLVADVFKNGDGKPINDRYLFVNRMGQTNVDRNNFSPNWIYSTFAVAAASRLPVSSEALVLGLGGGTIANKLNKLEFNVTAIELDERISEVAKEFFGLGSGIKVIVDDARHYIETTSKTYDLIFFDVFIGDVHPPHVLSKECFERASSILNDNGMIIVNFNGFLSDEIGKPGRSVNKTLKAIGLLVDILPTPGDESKRNTLFLAGKNKLDYDELRSPLFFKGSEIGMDSLFLNEQDFDFSDAVIFTDDQSNIDRLNAEASFTWRKSYNETLTRFFTENGVPLYN